MAPAQRPGKSRQDWGTPPAFIRAVEARFGPIVSDLACTTENCKAPNGYYLDEGVDAFRAHWAADHPHGNLWINPPFGDLEPWAVKCVIESARRHGLIFLLTPASIGTDWFAAHVHRKAMVLALSPRLTFEGAPDPYPRDLMMSVYGGGFSGFDCWRWR